MAASKIEDDEKLFCAKHNGQPIVYICKTNQTLVCTLCMKAHYYQQRKVHEFVHYRKENMKNLGEKLINTLEKKTNLVKETLLTLKDQKSCPDENLREHVKFVT